MTLDPDTHLSAPARPGVLGVASLVASDIKIAHSVFALPFAVFAAFLAHRKSDTAGTFAGELVLIVLCMVFARTFAMLVNRLADRHIDAANPRTAGRALAAGTLAPRDGLIATASAAVVFVACTTLFGVFYANWWPAALAVPALCWIGFYSFTKRFTALCHVFLGGALAASPLCAAIAIEPSALATTPALWWIAGMVLCWVAGFDVIYALQDLDYDRRVGLASVPAALGPRGAAWVSRTLHALAMACLMLAWKTDPRLGPIFALGIALTAALLLAEHVVLVRKGLAGLDMAFFTLNGIVSCLLGTAGVLDLLV